MSINLESKPISIHKKVEVKHTLAGILHNHLILSSLETESLLHTRLLRLLIRE